MGEEADDEASDPDAALRVFRVLKDADGLDRIRFGAHRLNLGMLRLPQSRARIERAWELLRTPAPAAR